MLTTKVFFTIILIIFGIITVTILAGAIVSMFDMIIETFDDLRFRKNKIISTYKRKQ